MCYFITIAVDEKHESTLKQKLRSSFRLSPSENPYIKARLKPQDVSFVMADGMCACGLFRQPQLVENEDREEKLRLKYSKPKYKKLGWTEAKIERAIADILSKPANEFSGLRADLRWQLCDLVADVGRVLILVHFYSGDTETDEVQIKSTKAITCEDLRDNDAIVDEDSLVEIAS